MVENIFNKHETDRNRVLKGKEEKDTKQGMVTWGNKRNSREELK